jgi:hypothetical protein
MSDQLHTLATFHAVKEPQYLLDRRLNGPQSWSGCSSEEKILLPLLEIKPQSSSL